MHGDKSSNLVKFKGKLCSLKEVLQQLLQEDLFKLLKKAGLKTIEVICCYAYNKVPYTFNGVTIRPHVLNKEEVNVYTYKQSVILDYAI